ncbi:MAG: hypothetical protein M1832_000010 [Thelocarpon impressellum]|nr:MAG: hypothetical protein M1832_000010 [Thelocarpon impressellum]
MAPEYWRAKTSSRDSAEGSKETIETTATFIINHLSTVEAVRHEFELSGSIVFEGHPHAISETNEEVLQRRRQQVLQTSTPLVTVNGSGPVRVFTDVDDKGIHRRLAFVIEEKPLYKLTLDHLRTGLRPMDLRTDVIDRILMPAVGDHVGQFQYQSDRLVAAVITQIFSYMIEGGVRYGYIITGEAIVFLHIPSDDPSTIYYHLADPRTDVEAQMEAFDGVDYSHQTALGQVLAFSLLALGSNSNTNAWRQAAMGQLTPWEVDSDAILRRDGRHQIDLESFLERLRQQLERTLDSDCEPMGMDGARGALFRVTMVSHGYTLVAKGTVEVFVTDLRHEEAVYRRLEALQGVHVPVCLGSIGLTYPYYYEIGVRIVHMMLLSWAGQRIAKHFPDSKDVIEDVRWKSEIAQAIEVIRSAGRVMVIDFERSEFVDELPSMLSPSSGNKRKIDLPKSQGVAYSIKPTLQKT